MMQLSPNDAFRHAVDLQRHGDFARAADIYRQLLNYFPDDVRILHMIGTAELQQNHLEAGMGYLRRALDIQPDQPQVLLNLGNGLLQQGHPDRAVPLFDRALRLRPAYAEAEYNRANAMTALGRTEEARAGFARAIQLNPRHAGAHYNLGNTLSRMDRFEEAIESYSRAIALAPDISGGYTNRGNAYRSLGRLNEALADYQTAIRHNPKSAEAHYNCANALRDLGQPEAALDAYATALSIHPDHAKAHANRGTVLVSLEKPEAALADFDIALKLDPDYPEAWNNKGNALMQLKRHEAALACFDKALALMGDFPEGLNNRGNALRKLARLEEALASYDRAIAIRPDYPEGHGNRATILRDLGRFDDAMEGYNRALAIKPDYTNAIVNKSHLLLLTGQFREGWDLYETRWEREIFKKQARHYAQPAWHGDTDIAGKRLLIYHEQGLGDFIQCARFAPMAAAAGAKVFLETPPPLIPLMQTLSGDIEIFPVKTDPPDFDLHCPTMSLPHAFHATEARIGENVPYLSVNPARREKWQARLGGRTRPRIGIAWAGNPEHINDHNRSIALARLKPLLDQPYDFHLLQPDVREDEENRVSDIANLHLHGDALADFADTAALMAEMDQVITVDTSVAHLAGALGLPVWILLPWVPDWRWMLKRTDTPWYPQARLWRQENRGDWDGVITGLIAALKEKFR